MSDRTILVTGASSDLGCELIRRLLSRPSQPRILAHCFTGLERIRALQQQLGAPDLIVPLEADFRSAGNVAAMIERVLNEFAPPREVVHLPAAKLRYERFSKLDWDRLETDLTIQVRSITQILQLLLPHLVSSPQSPARGNAKVVIVLSSVTLGPPPKYMSAYAIVKFALLGLMRTLAAEYSGQGVNINAVSPSMIETRFLEELPGKAVELAAQSHPLGRNARPSDIVPAIEYLLSPGADYINGVNVPLTGGQAI